MHAARHAAAFILASTFAAGTFISHPTGPAAAAAAVRVPAAAPLRLATATATAAIGQHITLPSGRTYWLAGATGGTTPRALVIGLTTTAHDAAYIDDAAWVTGDPATTGWHQHATAHGYTLALADPVAGAWNLGKGTNDPNSNGWPGSGQDDLGYLLQVAADATTRTPIDPAQVYAAGGSAGGALAWLAAATHPEVFRACASASGWAPYRYPTQPIDCRHDHGTSDTTVPIRGGTGYAGYIFPPTYNEMARAPRGSRVALYATSGGHDIPGWWAGAAWTFFTAERTAQP